MNCPQCGLRMEYKGNERVGNTEEEREVWECKACNYVFYKAP
jgi:transposase-like protein